MNPESGETGKKVGLGLKINMDEAVTKCVVQLLILGVIRDLITNQYDKLKDEV